MNILEINTEKTWRGGERQTCFNIRGILQHGVTVDLLCRKGFPLSRNAKTLPISVYEVNGAIGSICFLATQGRKYDLIHTQTAKAQFYAVITKLIHRRPVVYTRRVDFVPKGRFTLLKYRLTDKTVAISQAIRNILIAFKLQDVVVISDAVEKKVLNREKAEGEIIRNKWKGKKIIATTAAFVQHKDPLTLIKAIAELTKIRKDFIFLHFGNGVLKSRMEQEITQLNVSDYYHLMGFAENVEDFFSVFDVFVMSSEEEGLGSSVLDAFIYKVPVVSTNAGGLSEIVNDRGLLSPVKDARQLAENMNRMLDDIQLRKDFTEKAYAYVVNEHSIEKIGLAYYQLFSGLIKKS